MRPTRHPRRHGIRPPGAFITFAALLAIAALGGTAGATEGADEWYDDYVPGDFGRVRYVENGLEIERADLGAAEPHEEGGVNAPIMPGDRISTANDERAEIQLAGGSLIRIDRATEVTFLSMPDPYAEIADTTVLQLEQGTLRIAAGLERDEEFRIDTPAASIYALDDSDLRIEVGRSGRTRVWSRRGTVEVVGDGASVLLRTGTETEVHAGSGPDNPWAFNTFATDGFDLWVAERAAGDRGVEVYDRDSRVVYEALPSEVRPYYSELSRHGRWVFAADYGYVWSPAAISVGWRPYQAGYWRYGPRGYFWVSHEPWGWAPYHYGRWNYISDVGWCWSPGRVFGGAWVSWSWGSAYVGWSPLDYWNRPVYVRQVHHHYYDPYAWTFVSYNHFSHRDYRHWSVPLSRVEAELPRHAVAIRPARTAPRLLVDSPEARRAAVAQVRADARRPLPAGKAVHSARGFGQIEDRMTRDGVRDASVRGARDRRSGDAARTERRMIAAPTAQYPSRIRGSRGGAIDGTTVRDTPVRRTAPRAARSSDDSRPKPQLRPVERGTPVDQRVRDIYRRVAAPRESPESVDRRRADESTGREAPAARTGARATDEKPSAERPARTQETAPRAERPASPRGGEKGADRTRPSTRDRGGATATPKPRPRNDRDDDRPNVSQRTPRRPAPRSTPTRRTTRVSATTSRVSTRTQRTSASTRPSTRSTTPRPSSQRATAPAPTRTTSRPAASTPRSAPSRPAARSTRTPASKSGTSRPAPARSKQRPAPKRKGRR